jgi:hypothetical protein
VDGPNQKPVAGPAHFIEQWTDGIFREVMALVMDACAKLLQRAIPLTLDILHQAWMDMKRAKVVNFLDQLRASAGGTHG